MPSDPTFDALEKLRREVLADVVSLARRECQVRQLNEGARLLMAYLKRRAEGRTGTA